MLSKFCGVRFLWINDQSLFALYVLPIQGNTHFLSPPFCSLEDPTQVQPLLKHLNGGGLDPVTFPGMAITAE